jgi:acetoin utilization deacetylase AcuC-like enzyme
LDPRPVEALKLCYTDHLEFPLPAKSRFPLRKYRMLRDLLAREAAFEFAPAPEASAETVALVHDREYVSAFVDGRLPESVMRRIGFPWSPELVRRTMASVGGTLAAARHALDEGFGGTLAGGTHHAFREKGAGYCVFNDIAVAITALRTEGRIKRAAVVDLDVHQGDGTASIFAGDADVLTLSMHSRTNFPFEKQRSTIDIDVDDGVTDEEYVATLAAVLPRVRDFAADIVFYQSGVDALASDRLGSLSLTQEGLRRRDQLVFETFAGVPVAVTLGGGYSEPIEHTVSAHANTFLTAAAVFTRNNRAR